MANTEYTFSGGAAGGTGGKSSTPSLEWRDYVAILLERIWIAITVLVVVVVLSVIHLKRQTPIYRSAARILVEDSHARLLNIQDVLSMNRSSLETFNTHIKALSSRKMISEALKSEGLHDNPDFLPLSIPEEKRGNAALGFLRIVPVPSSRLIDVIVEHHKPELAACFANVVAKEYIRQDLDIRLSRSVEIVEWLRSQSEDYRAKLEKGLIGLQDYREKHQAVSLEEGQDVVVSKLKALNQSLTLAENRSRELQSDLLAVQAATNNVDVLSELPVISSDPEVQNARTALLEKRNEMSRLRSKYLYKHPIMQSMLTEITVLSVAYRKACLVAVARIEARYNSAMAIETNLRSALETQEKEAFALDRRLVEYQQLKRGVDADQEVYEAMLGRIRQAHMAGDMTMNLIRIVDPAQVSKRPVRPVPRRAILNGILLGLMLGVGLSFLSHAVDNRLRRVDEVEGLFGLPVLAAIPHIRKTAELARRRVAELESRSAPAEAFRTLRATLGLQAQGRDARTILITSVSSSEGKSLVASNLATVFSQNNAKTLLIDADMRRPTAHHAFDFGGDVPEYGLSHVLTGQVPWADAVRPTSTENLDVLLAGEIPPNPAELLGSPMMKELMDEVEGKYDRIILDSPPVVGVSDPLVMLPRAHGIIFVIHFGKTRRHAAKMALQQLHTGGTPLLGIVLDNVKTHRAGSYYYYYQHNENYHSLADPVGKTIK